MPSAALNAIPDLQVRFMKSLFRSFLKLILAPFIKSAQTVEFVDFNKYLGRWYEIARLPNFFEKDDMQNIVADYSLLPSGNIAVRNSSTRAGGKESEVNGVARAVDTSNSKLKVTFAPAPLRVLPFVWGNYWILELDDDYQWALVGDPTHKFLWILSRTPQLADSTYEHVCGLITKKGYDVDRLIKPLHDS